MWSAETVFLCALVLLGRSQASFPPVQFVENAPSDVSRLAAGYTRHGERQIVLVTSTTAFARARLAANQCGDVEALREIAGVLAHEEWHLRHGAEEEGAYNAQLTALQSVGADSSSQLFHNVARAKRVVRDRAKRNAK